MVAPAYFKTAFNSRSIVAGGAFQILIVDYINIEILNVEFETPGYCY